MSKEEAYEKLLDIRYEYVMKWKAINEGIISTSTTTDADEEKISIEHIDHLNISTTADTIMTLINKNFQFDLFSFDPEWRDDSKMYELLDGVKNPLDFKQVLESNTDKANSSCSFY